MIELEEYFISMIVVNGRLSRYWRLSINFSQKNCTFAL